MMNPPLVDRIDWGESADSDGVGCPVCGREACEIHIDGAESDSPKRQTFARAVDIINAPRPVEIIEGIAFAGCLTVVVSESGTGKTFVLLNAAAAVSDGVSWHGRTIRRGSVAYLSFEGDALGTRCRALMEVAGSRLEHVYILRAHDPLSPHVTRDGEVRSSGELFAAAALADLQDDIRQSDKPPIVLCVIDTVRASMTGSEDSSEHVAAYLRAVRRLAATVPSAAWILAHHAGWQDGDQQRKRERGSSAWRGNCDATLYLEAGDSDDTRDGTPLTLRTLKVRDAEQPAPLHFVRRRVELLETDSRGEPLTTCIIESDHRTREDRETAAAAAVERDQRDVDVKLLRTITERPELATSQDRLRMAIGARKAVVGESISRLVRRGMLLPGARNQPYTITDRGRAALSEAAQ